MIKPAALYLSILSFQLLQSSPSIAEPQNGEVVLGDGMISSEGQTTIIDQNSDRLAIHWGSFDIGSEETVTFNQPTPSSIALNVDYSGKHSELFGQLNANGQVLLLNKHGVLIGESAAVKAGGFLASDLSVDINDFSDGDFRLFDESVEQGGIVNLGEIKSTLPNGIYILGQFFDNQGNIESSNGDIHLASANELIVKTSKDGLIGVQLNEHISHDISPTASLIRNQGAIIAFNGNIYLDLFYSDSLKVETVNNQGIVSAVAITETNGEIFLTPETFDENSAKLTTIEDILSESQLSEDPSAPESASIEIEPQPKASIDAIMPSCTGVDMGEESCKKYNAIKRYLGRLLLGGSLPEQE